MAIFQVILATGGGNATAGQAMPLPAVDSRGGPGGTLTTSATSQQVKDGGGSLVTAPQAPGLMWRVAVSGGAVWVTFGANPVAKAGVTWLLPDGSSLDLVAVAGDACAVVDAS